MAPAITSVSPSRVPVGVATAITITGTGLVTAALAAPGCTFASVVTASATSVTATVTLPLGAYGGDPVTVTLTNGDASGTATVAMTGGPPASGKAGEGYVNPQVAAAASPTLSGTETTMLAVNPAFNPATEVLGQSPAPVSPELGASSQVNPIIAQNLRNQESDLRGEGLGDYVNAARPTALAQR